MISILIPIYNGIEFVEESVSSVIQQTFKEWELIIGINGHPKNSDILFQLASIYRSIGDFSSALKYYDEGLHTKCSRRNFLSISN